MQLITRKDAGRMSNRVRLKWGDRVKQPRRPVRITQHTPFDPEIFGPSLSPDAKRLRALYRKGL
jgi:hypothetical protein